MKKFFVFINVSLFIANPCSAIKEPDGFESATTSSEGEYDSQALADPDMPDTPASTLFTGDISPQLRKLNRKWQESYSDEYEYETEHSSEPEESPPVKRISASSKKHTAIDGPDALPPKLISETHKPDHIDENRTPAQHHCCTDNAFLRFFCAIPAFCGACLNGCATIHGCND